MHDTAPVAAATVWLARFNAALEARDIAAVLDLFAEDCYWRDLVAFTWNVKTMEGKPAIAAMLGATLAATRPLNWRVESASGSHSDAVYVWFRFATSIGQARGHMLL